MLNLLTSVTGAPRRLRVRTGHQVTGTLIVPYPGCQYTMVAMELARAVESLQAAELCLRAGLVNSAASRAYYAMFQAAQAALEAGGLVRSQWSPTCKFEPRDDPAKEALSESAPGLSDARSCCAAKGRLRGVRGKREGRPEASASGGSLRTKS